VSTVTDDTDTETSTRYDTFKEDVGTLKVRRGSAALEQRLRFGGGALIPLGIVFIILGWWGASDTVLVDEQMSYLISGGLLGLALVITGACLYIRYWLARQRYWMARATLEQREQSEQLIASLNRIEALLRASSRA
jgi:hypothetical protein